jgi:hypothetical protein
VDGCPICGNVVLARESLTPSLADVTCGLCGRFVITPQAVEEIRRDGSVDALRTCIRSLGGRPLIDADLVRRLRRPEL